MIRFLFIGVGLVVGAALPGAALLMPALMGGLLAYTGPERHTLWLGTLMLMCVEVAFGIDLGILSLSFLGTALVLKLMSRFIAFTPWAVQEGWALADSIRSVAIAIMLAIMMVATAVLVGAVYGHGAVGLRLAAELAPSRLLVLVPLCMGVLVMFRRMDIPFQKPIRFGQ